MALTKNATTELLNVINGYNNNDQASTILPNPMFKSQTTTTFISDIEAKLNVNDVKIIDLHHSKDIVVVVANYSGDTKGVLAYYNPQFDIYEILSLYDNGTVDNDGNTIFQDLPPFQTTKINRQNILYGLNKVNDKVNFFVMSDLIEIVGVLSGQDFIDESFFSTLFDIETEIIKNPDKPTEDLDVKVGNSLFSDYEKVGYNQDAFENSTYSFVLWKDNGDPNTPNSVEHVKFQVELSQTEAITGSWDINEPIKLSQGVTGAGSDFEGLSVIDILSGEQTLSKTETSLGSIIFSTQQEAGQNQSIKNWINYKGSKPRSFSFSQFDSPRLYTNDIYERSFIIANNDNFFDVWLSKIKKIIDSGGNILDEGTFKGQIIKTGGIINIISKYSNKDITTIDINKDLLMNLLSGTTIELIEKVVFTSIDAESLFNPKSKLEIKYSINIDGVNNELKVLERNFDEDFGLGDILGNIRGIADHNNPGRYWGFEGNISTDITEDITIVYEENQVVVQANTTSQITIENDGKSNIYNIVQSENDSYEGTQPVFISPRKAFIPLKEKNGQYAIFEFNGVVGIILGDKFANEQVTQDGDLSIQLINPDSITEVKVDGTPNTNFTLDKTSGKVTITELTSGQSVSVEYKSFIGTPRKVNVSTSTTGKDIYITGILDAGELSNTGVSIVGAGDDSAPNISPSEVFGFNLYKTASNIDYDAIAEEVETLANFKVRHVKGYRQKDLLFMYAYNEDYSEAIEWVQIYPDSFKPYTYQPYANPDEYFALERFNQNTQQELRTSVFDRELLDVAVTSNSVIATTTAENTDLNNPNNDSTVIFGHTNEPLLWIEEKIEKERNERRSLQLTLNTSFIDKLQDKNITNQSESELLANLFGDKNKDAHNLIALDQATIYFDDGTELSRDATDFTTINEAESKIEVGITLVDKTNTKQPTRLDFTNKNGDIIITIDLSDNQCLGGLRNINFDIVIADNADGIFYQYARYDDTGYNKPYEPIAIAKGGK